MCACFFVATLGVQRSRPERFADGVRTSEAGHVDQIPCRMAVVVKTVLGSHFGAGEFTTHFRTYLSGWDVHWGMIWLLAPWPAMWIPSGCRKKSKQTPTTGDSQKKAAPQAAKLAEAGGGRWWGGGGGGGGGGVFWSNRRGVPRY